MKYKPPHSAAIFLVYFLQTREWGMAPIPPTLDPLLSTQPTNLTPHPKKYLVLVNVSHAVKATIKMITL